MATSAVEKDPAPFGVDEQNDGTAVVDLPEDDTGGGGEDDAGAGSVTDERLIEDDEDAASASQELRGARSETEREEIRARRRQERHDKKESARRREQDKDRQLSELQQIVQQQQEQLNLVLNKSRGTELAQLDGAIKRTQEAENYYRGVIADGVTQQNGAVVADATARLQAVGREQENLVSIRKAFNQGQRANVTEANRSPGQVQLPDPETLKHTVAWMNENKWYDPKNQDAETLLVRALDSAVYAEGYKPDTPEYWSELTKRVQANLPGRAKTGKLPVDTTSRRSERSVVTGSGSSSSSADSGGRKSFILSADRVKALKDAGMWEDPKARSDAIRRFRDYDRDHAADRR